MRIHHHPVLPPVDNKKKMRIFFQGEAVEAYEGEPIAAALIASGVRVFRYTPKRGEPRGLFCAIGLCTDCMMIVNGIPNTRTCVTPVEDGMQVEVQYGFVDRSRK